ncbi:TRAP transporter substrate-binding protein [Photobacterium makurazakiensis]|uniref:TRAP transporter substrate-binding protein n=1 Tax=Photobacterium makurazakiensis TaxID=2910234 RepID=UPI003D0E4D95
MKKLLSLPLSLLIALPLTAQATETYTFKYAHTQTSKSLRSDSMKYFKKELEKRTEGRIKVKNYFGGVLGNERESFDALATGVLQGTRGGNYPDASFKYNIMSLPYLVQNWDQAECLVQSNWMQNLSDEAADNGIHIPAVGISIGFRAHGLNKANIKSVDDLKGVKMRVPSGDEVLYHLEQAIGSNPQGVAWTETYSALRTGVVDGVTAQPTNMLDSKLNEVLKSITIDNHSIGPDPLMVSKSWYDSLPADLQTTFDDVARETMAMNVSQYRQEETKSIEQMKKNMTVVDVSDSDKTRLKEQSKSVYDYFVKRGDFSWDDIDAAIKASNSCS